MLGRGGGGGGDPVSYRSKLKAYHKIKLICTISIYDFRLGGGGGVCGQNVRYHVAAFVIPFNLKCTFTMSEKVYF